MTCIRAAVVMVVALGLGDAWLGTVGAGDPAANRKTSVTYDAVVRGNPAFRADREHVECDPIESLDLRAQCIASFREAVPMRIPHQEVRPPDDLVHPRVTVTNGPIRNPDDD